MDSTKSKIIDAIIRNRISATEVSDALGKAGVVDGPRALIQERFVCGEVRYIYGHSESNWSLHEQGKDVPDGGILFVDAFDCNDRALFGDIVAKYFILYKQVQGLVVNGFVRDMHILVKQGYPIWARGVTPLGCRNKEVAPTASVLERAEQARAAYEGGVAVADDTGITVIPRDRLSEDTLKRLNFIELQEDIWYYCIDTLKWSTYDTICKKRYLENPDVLPEALRAKLEGTDF